MVRVDFPGREDERELSRQRKSEQISWEEFFRVFDEQKLAFIYYPDEHQDDPTLTHRFIKGDEVGELEAGAVDGDNFSNPDARQTLPSSPVDEQLGNGEDEFGFDPEQDNETLEHAPSPQIQSEQAVSGNMPDPGSDDDTTDNARDFDLVLEDDPQAQQGK